MFCATQQSVCLLVTVIFPPSFASTHFPSMNPWVFIKLESLSPNFQQGSGEHYFKFGVALLTALDVLAILKNMALCPLDALFVRVSNIVARRAVIRKGIPRADGCNDAETMDDFIKTSWMDFPAYISAHSVHYLVLHTLHDIA